MSSMTAVGIVAVVTLALYLWAALFGEVCDLLVYWWQKR